MRLLLFHILFIDILIFLGRQAWFLIRARACTVNAVGVIIELEEAGRWFRSYHGRSRFYLHVAYDAQGERQFGRTRQLFLYDEYAERMSVNVWVNPKNPAHFVMEGEKAEAGRDILLYAVVLGITALLVGILEFYL